MKNNDDSNSNKYAYVALGYLIFFIVLAVIFRVSPRENKEVLYREDIKEQEKFKDFKISKLLANNFSFNYILSGDGYTVKYDGCRTKDESSFTYNNFNYYMYSDKYFSDESGTWNMSKNPFLFSELLEPKNINDILIKSTYVSRTIYSDNSVAFDFEVGSDVIENIINNKKLEESIIPNTIRIYTYKTGDIKKIVCDYSSYAKSIGVAKNNLNFELNFSDYGEINNIENPLQ